MDLQGGVCLDRAMRWKARVLEYLMAEGFCSDGKGARGFAGRLLVFSASWVVCVMIWRQVVDVLV